jgi:cob(I)alamin adenosyltransferase
LRLYTKTGDDGTTALFGGRRVRKHASRISAYGTVDELNSLLGVARAATFDASLDAHLAAVQNDLFVLGSDLATPMDHSTRAVQRMDTAAVERLERIIDAVDASLPALRNFILPGGSEAAARLHLARTVCRRAERETDALAAEEDINPVDLQYLNRLSDLLFVLARLANRLDGREDTPWDRSATIND